MRNIETAKRKDESGQAIILVTLALFSMCGMMGLAVDLGWNYYDRKTEHNAAESAALAAVTTALESGTCNGPNSSGCWLFGHAGGSPCASVAAANPALSAGCTYATRNGFQDGSGTIQTKIFSDAVPATDLLVDPLKPASFVSHKYAIYYAAVTISHSVPQLFSAVMGKANATVAVKSVAVIANIVLPGAVILTNRAKDTSPVMGDGTDICLVHTQWAAPDITQVCNTNAFGEKGKGAGAESLVVNVPGGLTMDSCAQTGSSNPMSGCGTGYAGVTDEPAGTLLTGPEQVLANSGTGQYSVDSTGKNGSFVTTPNAIPGGPQFDDPLRGIGQPPVDSSVTNLANVKLGGLNGAQQNFGTAGEPSCGGNSCSASLTGGNSANNATIIGPGNYYGACTGAGCTGGANAANGQPLMLSCGGQNTCYFRFYSANGFGRYYFYNGLNIGPGVTVQFGPGQYVFAGTTPNSSFQTGVNPSLQMDTSKNGSNIVDGTCPNISGCNTPIATDAGELFVYTDLGYKGADGSTLPIPTGVSNYQTACGNCIGFGTSGIYSAYLNSNNDSANIILHGTNQSDSSFPSNLAPFQSVMWWQDQQNSYVKYVETGGNCKGCVSYDLTDPGGCPSGTIDNPCVNTIPSTGHDAAGRSKYSPQMDYRLGNTPGGSAKFGTYLSGGIYQPRGAWGVLDSYGTSKLPTSTPLQIINGSLAIDGRGQVPLACPTGVVCPQITQLTRAVVE